MKKVLFILLTICYAFTIKAQTTIDVTGSVRDAMTDEELIGVTILVIGSDAGTVTDIDGNFKMSVPVKSRLRISYVGYTSQEIVVTGETTTLEIKLQPETQLMDELVVVGYSAQKKSTLTGAVSPVSVADMGKRRVADVRQALQGQVAGVQVTQSTGAPGDEINIRIRGEGTIGNNNPLYVIDGVPTRELGFINPSDIESMTVLKDASAAAIYGSRASAGVIVITTKSGVSGKTQIDINYYAGIQNASNLPKMLNSTQYMDVVERAWSNAGYSGTNPYTGDKGRSDFANTLFNFTAAGNTFENSFFYKRISGAVRSLVIDEAAPFIKFAPINFFTGNRNFHPFFSTNTFPGTLRGTCHAVIAQVFFIHRIRFDFGIGKNECLPVQRPEFIIDQHFAVAYLPKTANKTGNAKMYLHVRSWFTIRKAVGIDRYASVSFEFVQTPSFFNTQMHLRRFLISPFAGHIGKSPTSTDIAVNNSFVTLVFDIFTQLVKGFRCIKFIYPAVPHRRILKKISAFLGTSYIAARNPEQQTNNAFCSGRNMARIHFGRSPFKTVHRADSDIISSKLKGFLFKFVFINHENTSFLVKISNDEKSGSINPRTLPSYCLCAYASITMPGLRWTLVASFIPSIQV